MIVHFWVWVAITVLYISALFLFKQERKKRESDSFYGGAGSCLFLGTLILVFWSLVVFAPEDHCDYACRERKDAKNEAIIEKERFETSGIVCAESQDNDSGNICRTRLGNKECVTILPDDDTKTELNRTELTTCVPVEKK